MASKQILRHYDPETKMLETYSINIDFDVAKIRENMCIKKVLTSNDRHFSYTIEGNMNLTGILYKIIDPDDREVKEQSFIFKDETFDEYLIKMQKLKEHNRKWIFNVIEGLAECENVIYKNDDFVLMPDYTWDKQGYDKIHILAIARNRSIMSIRDIGLKDLEMLERVKKESLKQIELRYGIQANKLKVFFHYPPSTYLLHIHIAHISKCDTKTSFDKCYDFDTVIRNIKMDANYYRGIMRITDVPGD